MLLFSLLAFAKPVQAAAVKPKCNIVYDFGGGRTYQITPDVAMTLIKLNKDGTPYVDPATKLYVVEPARALAFLNALQYQYPTESNTLDFYSTSGEYIQMTRGARDTLTRRYINVPRELAYLMVAIPGNANEVRSPEWSVGNTYIEVDISDQTLYYYENCEIVQQTPIVTGCVNAGHNTPKGFFYVRAKQTNQTLVGANYRSFVNYWIPIVGNSIGIHDATWRSGFGGDIYISNGSHGCINVPLAQEQQLFDRVQVGTPVVVIP